jgi:aryl-alcohol dehydrogenase-like predicted oxidoreductase
VAYSPLGRGFLTGAFRSVDDLADGDFRRSQPRLADANLAANLAIVDKIEQLAAASCVTPAQLALAWVQHQGPDVVPIPGTKRRRYLEENAAAADIELTQAELDQLTSIGTAAGDRYSDMSRTNG